MRKKERNKITSSNFRASDQALAEGQSTKVNYQDLAKEHQDQRTRDTNENSEQETESGWRRAGKEDKGNGEKIVETSLFRGLWVVVLLKEHG